MKHLLPNAFARLCQRIAPAALLLLGLAPPAWAALTVNGNATVLDTNTRLVWDQCPSGLSGASCAAGSALRGTWAQALDAAVAANAVSYKGFRDWRVPNMKELESITKFDIYSPAIDATAFPGTLLDYFWASTTDAKIPSAAVVVEFMYGGAGTHYKTLTHYVRLVRSGQSLAPFDILATAQTISFANPGPQSLGTTPTLSATASSGLTPTFTSSTTAVCTITSAGVLTLATEGTCTIAADQAGDGTYNPAPRSRRASRSAGPARQCCPCPPPIRPRSWVAPPR